jgi:NAD(P)H-hydrate epimerase
MPSRSRVNVSPRTDGRYPTVAASELGWLTKAEMIEVDRIMIDELHITLIQMMENAGRNLARLILDLYNPATVAVYAGSGGNGGGGLVAARHLANAGVHVSIVLTRDRSDVDRVPGHQLDILDRLGVHEATTPAEVAVDALIGYSLQGAPRDRTAELIEQLSSRSQVVVALDNPSGLDVTTGDAPGVAVAAEATLTLALPKRGLRQVAAVGDLYVADISVPPQVMRDLGALPPDFAASAILRIGD